MCSRTPMERPRPPPLEPAHCVPTAPSCAVGAQKKFTDLSGAAEHQGDLKSVVLHKMAMSSQHSTFPVGKHTPLSNTMPLSTPTRNSDSAPVTLQLSACASRASTTAPSRRPAV